MKRIVSLLLVFCLVVSTAFAEEEKQSSLLDSVGGWFSQATESTSNWASQAWEDASDWTSQAWKDTSNWATQAWDDVSAWSIQAWNDVSEWTIQAWTDSAKWISQRWDGATTWTAANWDHFIVWLTTVAAGSPYAWIKDVVLDHGILAYDAFAKVRSFLNSQPSIEQIRESYDEALSELSLINEDKDILWDMLQQWSEEKGLSIDQTAQLALPFLTQLVVAGEPVIGPDVKFSGPVVGQYLLTVLEAMKLNSTDAADMRLKILHAALESLTRPTIIGDTEQNTLITDDHYYIENFTYDNGKYQMIMIASRLDDTSRYPLLHNRTIQQQTEQYFKNAECGDVEQLITKNSAKSESLPFTYAASESTVFGKTFALWTEKNCYLFFIATDQEWQNEEVDSWYDSILLTSPDSITFEADMESDGAEIYHQSNF
ncbi:MAG: hypothetical protein IJ240_00935 [Clostridia bacterium]|nr:hypothetical protein [Clostridia bacterium]